MQMGEHLKRIPQGNETSSKIDSVITVLFPLQELVQSLLRESTLLLSPSSFSPAGDCKEVDDHLPVADECIDFVITRTEASELYFLTPFDLLGVTITPLNWNIRVCVSID